MINVRGDRNVADVARDRLCALVRVRAAARSFCLVRHDPASSGPAPVVAAGRAGTSTRTFADQFLARLEFW